MTKATSTKTDADLPGNLSERQLENAKHARTFPPDTPHSVINSFEGHKDVDVIEYADPREAEKESKKSKKEDDA